MSFDSPQLPASDASGNVPAVLGPDGAPAGSNPLAPPVKMVSMPEVQLHNLIGQLRQQAGQLDFFENINVHRMYCIAMLQSAGNGLLNLTRSEREKRADAICSVAESFFQRDVARQLALAQPPGPPPVPNDSPEEAPAVAGKIG